MNDVMSKPVNVPKSSLFRWEIGLALLVKIVFLTGLWFLIFRWPDRPVTKPDIAAHFMPPATQSQVLPEFLSEPVKESRHDR